MYCSYVLHPYWSLVSFMDPSQKFVWNILTYIYRICLVFFKSEDLIRINSVALYISVKWFTFIFPKKYSNPWGSWMCSIANIFDKQMSFVLRVPNEQSSYLKSSRFFLTLFRLLPYLIIYHLQCMLLYCLFFRLIPSRILYLVLLSFCYIFLFGITFTNAPFFHFTFLNLIFWEKFCYP